MLLDTRKTYIENDVVSMFALDFQTLILILCLTALGKPLTHVKNGWLSNVQARPVDVILNQSVIYVLSVRLSSTANKKYQNMRQTDETPHSHLKSGGRSHFGRRSPILEWRRVLEAVVMKILSLQMVQKINGVFEARRGKKRMKRVSQSTESSSGRGNKLNSHLAYSIQTTNE